MHSSASFLAFAFAFFVFLVSLALGGWVLFRNFRDKKHITFAIFSVAIASWVLSSALADFANSEKYAMLFAQLAIVGPPIFIAAVLVFSYVYPRELSKVSWRKIIWIFVPIAIFEFFVPTKYNIESVKLEDWGTSYVSGHLYTALLLIFLIYLFFIVRNFIKKYHRFSGIAREQIVYSIWAVVLGCVIGLTTNVILPWFGITKASLFGPGVAVLVLNVIFTYTIIRYRLFDIRVVIQTSLVYALVFACYGGLFFGILYISEQYLREIIDISPSVGAAISAFLFAVCFPSLKQFFVQTTDKIFFKDKYVYSDVLHQLSHVLTTSLDMDEIIDKVVESVFNTMKVDKVIFLLLDERRKAFVPKKIEGFVSAQDMIYKIDEPLFKYFSKHNRILVYEELERMLEDIHFKNRVETEKIMKGAGKDLKKMGAAVCLPVLANDKLLGVFCLGEKVSKKIFTSDDLNLLSTLNNQLALVIQNAKLYQDLKAKQENAEKMLKLMVGRELKMLELKKSMGK